jgi:hypothetical protein
MKGMGMIYKINLIQKMGLALNGAAKPDSLPNINAAR